MESMYVVEPGCYLRRSGAAINICKGKKILQQVPSDGLKKLMLVGYVSLTGNVMDFLISRRVETVFLTTTGRFRARLGIDEHRHVQLRQAQYIKLSKPAYAAKVAGRLVEAKLENMAGLLIARARDYDEAQLRVAAARIRSLKKAAVSGQPDLARLRGLEGAGTRIYFADFGSMIRNPAFEFNGRNRRPPRDPVNALLSFVYTLLTNDVQSAIKARGLDPYLGTLHEISYGRPSLACDLVEEYRCHLGDRMVLGLINRKMIRPEDFIYRDQPPDNFIDEREMKEKRPVIMKPAVMRTFITAYEEMMGRKIHLEGDTSTVAYRTLIYRQVSAFADSLLADEALYHPFTLDH